MMRDDLSDLRRYDTATAGSRETARAVCFSRLLGVPMDFLRDSTAFEARTKSNPSTSFARDVYDCRTAIDSVPKNNVY